MVDEVVVRIEDLNTTFQTDAGPVEAVRGVSLTLRSGRTLGVVGESGSGKSAAALSLMRLLPEGATVSATELTVLGRDVLRLPCRELQAFRGRDLAMIFQEPMTSLNPVYTVGEQVIEVILQHEGVSRSHARERTIALFEEVGISEPASRMKSYPHQLSGGQKQRVMIAMALSCNPRVLIADEPTTALDVTVQAQVLDLLRQLRDKRGMSMLFISHDLGVIAEIADDVAVMYQGRVVEKGPVMDVLRAPQHPYTRGLLACRPRLDTTWRRLPTVFCGGLAPPMPPAHRDAVESAEPQRASVAGNTLPVLDVRDLTVHFPVRGGLFQRVVRHVDAVSGVSFSVRPGETLGLVGESGCGKTTTGRAILRLIEPTAGTVRFRGEDFLALKGEGLRRMRKEIQIIFQDSYSSLNPRMSLVELITEPMKVHAIGHDDADRVERAAVLLGEVGLSPDHLPRYPHEFSGGQRQRICIARALSVGPSFIVCDEPVSALDVSVQAQVLNLLKDLQEQRGLTYLFISHDLSVVKFMCDTIAVMQAGRIVEMGPPASIYEQPLQEYTRRLIAAIPSQHAFSHPPARREP